MPGIGRWGVFGVLGGVSPCFLGEDLLVANTDTEYMIVYTCGENYNNEIIVGESMVEALNSSLGSHDWCVIGEA